MLQAQEAMCYFLSVITYRSAHVSLRQQKTNTEPYYLKERRDEIQKEWPF